MSESIEPFIRWSPSHWAVLAVTVIAAAGFLWIGSKQGLRGRRILCRALAVIVALELAGEYIWRACSDAYGPWKDNLPLHFCSFMGIVSVYALWKRSHWACSVVYFGVLAASIQGLLTPALEAGFPSMAFFLFFLSHSLLFLSALSIPVLLGWRARRWDDVRSLLLMDAYVLCIIPINLWLGANYGYTQGSPVEGCLLDYLGPAPWYYLWLQLPALGLFRLMLLPVRERTGR